MIFIIIFKQIIKNIKLMAKKIQFFFVELLTVVMLLLLKLFRFVDKLVVVRVFISENVYVSCFMGFLSVTY